MQESPISHFCLIKPRITNCYRSSLENGSHQLLVQESPIFSFLFNLIKPWKLLYYQRLPAVPRKWLASTDCDIIYIIYPSVHSLHSLPNPFRGTPCSGNWLFRKNHDNYGSRCSFSMMVNELIMVKFLLMIIIWPSLISCTDGMAYWEEGALRQ